MRKKRTTEKEDIASTLQVSAKDITLEEERVLSIANQEEEKINTAHKTNNIITKEEQ